MLNDSKTEILHLHSRHVPYLPIPSLQIGGSDVILALSARNLGVVIDSSVTMSQHVSNVCKCASYALYKIGRLRKFLDKASTENLVHAFITSRLDNCNSLFFGLPACELDKLQRIQNAAARLVLKVKGRCHMKPVLRQLHWLPVRKRIMFKIILITFKAIHGIAPKYINDIIIIRTQTRSLRSSSSILLKSPPLRSLKTASYGHRAFSASAPALWNQLPAHIRDISSVNLFKSRLKTHLFTLPDA